MKALILIKYRYIYTLPFQSLQAQWCLNIAACCNIRKLRSLPSSLCNRNVSDLCTRCACLTRNEKFDLLLVVSLFSSRHILIWYFQIGGNCFLAYCFKFAIIHLLLAVYLRGWQRRRTKLVKCVGKKNQLDVIFCILYFSSNSCSTCFGQPCAHHQELTTAWCYSLVLYVPWYHNWPTGPVVIWTHPWTHYLPTGFDNLPAATAHTNTRL